jgi:hypothetical protein
MGRKGAKDMTANINANLLAFAKDQLEPSARVAGARVLGSLTPTSGNFKGVAVRL